MFSIVETYLAAAFQLWAASNTRKNWRLKKLTIAANSVVTKDLPANVLAAGSPAKVIRPIQRFKYNPSGKLPPEWEDEIHART
jgi:hypothetical protein